MENETIINLTVLGLVYVVVMYFIIKGFLQRRKAINVFFDECEYRNMITRRNKELRKERFKHVNEGDWRRAKSINKMIDKNNQLLEKSLKNFNPRII